MIRFNDYKYERIDYDEESIKIKELIDNFKNASDVKQAIKFFKEIIEVQNRIEEMADYADIRNMRDRTDSKFNNEMDYWNNYKPKFDLLFSSFYNCILSSPYLDNLKSLVPINFFNSIEYQMRINNDDIIELQQKENELKQKYREIVGSKIKYNGEEITLSGFAKYFDDENRKIRASAHDAYNDFFYSHLNELDDIFFELVSIRNKIAIQCGFNNYSEYSLYKLRRFGYDYKDIKTFRDGIIKYFSPIVEKLKDLQRSNLEVDELKYYDSIFFKKPARLKYHGEELLANLVKVFKRIDDDLAEFFDTAVRNGYIDLLSSKDKVNFAITNYLSESGMPVVTGNYKETVYDATMSFHETGHAYQKLNASCEDKKYIVSSLLKYPTFEIAEMFSYAMQLIALDKSDILFDEDNYEKYYYSVIKDFITTLPYICLVDEFQEVVYRENLDNEEIRTKWLELAHKYNLDVSNSGHINLDSGGYFYRQNHILLNPFYYIDYALSYFGAFAIYSRCGNSLDAFNETAKVASYYPLKDLLKSFDIPSLFEEESIKTISLMLKDKLNIN